MECNCEFRVLVCYGSKRTPDLDLHAEFLEKLPPQASFQ